MTIQDLVQILTILSFSDGANLLLVNHSHEYRKIENVGRN